VADGGRRAGSGLHQSGDSRRQLGRPAVVLLAEFAASVVQLFHRVSGRQRPYHWGGLHAVLHGVPVGGRAMGARRAVLRFVVVTRLHCLPLLNLHRLLYHHRPILLGRSAGAVPQVAHQTQGRDTYSNKPIISF